MVSTYTSNFGIEKMGSGDQAGTWGTTTNYNLDILDRVASYASVTLSSVSETLTVREASPDTGASNVQTGMYRVLKFIDAGDIGGTVTLTVAPNDVATYFILINSLSGSRAISVTQGSGSNYSLANASAAVVYCDGAGATAAVTNASLGASALDDLSDVTISGPSSGQALTYNGSAWVNGAGGGGLFKGDNGQTGSSAGDIFRINDLTLDVSTTIDSDENASATGPLTVASGVTLTVSGNLAII